MYKILAIFISLFILCSCNYIEDYNDQDIFTYSYDYQFYGLDNDNCNFKASTVSTLKSVIDNGKTSIFMISSPTCLSCKNFAVILNDIAINKNVLIYNIDPYSDLYPVYDTSDFNLLLDILKDIGINDEKDYIIPILLIINEGVIKDYIVGYDTNVSDEFLTNKIELILNNSLLIK